MRKLTVTCRGFTDRATRDAFSHAVIDAVLRAFPAALEVEEEVP